MKFRHIQEMLANSSAGGKMLKTVTDSSTDGTACKCSGSQTFSLDFNELISLHSSYLLMFCLLNLCHQTRFLNRYT